MNETHTVPEWLYSLLATALPTPAKWLYVVLVARDGYHGMWSTLCTLDNLDILDNKMLREWLRWLEVAGLLTVKEDGSVITITLTRREV